MTASQQPARVVGEWQINYEETEESVDTELPTKASATFGLLFWLLYGSSTLRKQRWHEVDVIKISVRWTYIQSKEWSTWNQPDTPLLYAANTHQNTWKQTVNRHSIKKFEVCFALIVTDFCRWPVLHVKIDFSTKSTQTSKFSCMRNEVTFSPEEPPLFCGS